MQTTDYLVPSSQMQTTDYSLPSNDDMLLNIDQKQTDYSLPDSSQLHNVPLNIISEQIIAENLPEVTSNNLVKFYPTSLEPNNINYNIMPNRFELLKKQNNTRVIGVFPNLYDSKVDTCIQLNNYNIKPYDEGSIYFKL